MKNTTVRALIVELIKVLRKYKASPYDTQRQRDIQRELLDSRYYHHENLFSFKRIKQIIAQQQIPEDEICLVIENYEDYDGYVSPFIRFVYSSKETDEEYLYRLQQLAVDHKLLDKVQQTRIKIELELGVKLNDYQTTKLLQLLS